MVLRNSLVQYLTKKMKRKIDQEDGTSKKTKEDGSNHSSAMDMNLLVRLCSVTCQKLDFKTQMTISQLNRTLADIVESNAAHQLKKFRRHIQEDKYM